MELDSRKLITDSARSEVERHGNTIWHGVGSRVRADTPDGVVYVNAFLMQRVDASPPADVTVQRVIYDNNPDIVVDYVLPSTSPDAALDSAITVYRIPKDIEDPQEFFRGEDPVPSEWLTEEGEPFVDAIAKVTAGGRDVVIPLLHDSSGDYVFTNEGNVPLSSAGTLPFYST
jgi:hypothetical protein